LNFEFTPEQDEAAALAAEILRDLTTPERQRAADQTRFDADLWQSLASSGLLSLAVPEEYDGAGLGLLELCRVVIEAGRTVAPVPIGVHGACRLLIAELGTPEQKERALRSGIVTAAVAEDYCALPLTPATTATPSGGGFRLDGVKTVVPAGTIAEHLLVTATTPTGVGVFLVDPSDPGVTISPQTLTGGELAARIEFADVPAAFLTTDPQRLHDVLTVVACAEQLGVTEGALALTASYAKEREQFDRPIGTFQAVSQRLADGYIDTLMQRLTLWQAAWRLAEGLPAATEVAVAKLWAADAGYRISHTTVHVHGGVGIDLDGLAHRYFTTAKRFELRYGGSTEQALAVGRVLASEPA
jgi:3-oxocholest-4-en-26-oyl-CoA dehydrogenase beta subunit